MGYKGVGILVLFLVTIVVITSQSVQGLTTQEACQDLVCTYAGDPNFEGGIGLTDFNGYYISCNGGCSGGIYGGSPDDVFHPCNVSYSPFNCDGYHYCWDDACNRHFGSILAYCGIGSDADTCYDGVGNAAVIEISPVYGCGNGKVESTFNEQCDRGIYNKICGTASETICNSNTCQIQTCTGTNYCNNPAGIINPEYGEECDAGNLNGKQCEDLPGFYGGSLSCYPASAGVNKCKFDTSQCTDDDTYCGDGVIQSPNTLGEYEECDDNNGNDNDGCSSNCVAEPIKIISAKLEPYTCAGNTCARNQKIKATVRIQGYIYNNVNGWYSPQFPPPNFVYINASDSTGTCKISVTVPLNINGTYRNVAYNNYAEFFKCYEPINWNCPPDGRGDNPRTEPHDILPWAFTLPNTIPAACEGKTITKLTVNLRRNLTQASTTFVSAFFNNAPLRIGSYCGDNQVQPVNSFGDDESCDDGNNVNGDGCSATCQSESTCGNGVINSGEVCDGTNFGSNLCSTYGFSQGYLTCSQSCTVIDTTHCTYYVEGVSYGSLTNGCNSDTRICGRNGQMTVTVGLESNNDYPAAGTRVDLTLKNDPPVGIDPCQIFTEFDKITTGPGMFQITYDVNVPASYFSNPNCLNKTLTNTSFLRLTDSFGNIKSNTFNGDSAGFRIYECGDGQVDDLTSIGINYIEKCDYNLTSTPRGWMNTSCTNLIGYTGGTATCNQVSCQWNTNACTNVSCGNGIREASEQCDYGSTVGTCSGDLTKSCSSDSYCQEHDIGTCIFNGLNSLCSSTCQWTYCGDNYPQTKVGIGNGKNYSSTIIPMGNYLPIQYGFVEQCDDNNSNQYDRCAGNCTKTFCGDSRVQAPNGQGTGGLISIPFSPPYTCYDGPDGGCEQCDDGNTINNDTCNSCVTTYCGDGIRQAPNGIGQNGSNNLGNELCDDGNLGSGDKCYNNCTLTFCGDGIRQQPNGLGIGGTYAGYEQCDGGAGCNPDCTLMSCGNNVVEAGEECDDGGICSEGLNFCRSKDDCEGGASDKCLPVSGDGCSASCELTNCTISNITINCPNGICGKGDNIQVRTYYSGTNCNLANILRVDYMKSGLIHTGDCLIQYEPLFEQLQGMNSTFVSGSSPFTFNYAVPSISELCAGKTVDYVVSSLKQRNTLVKPTPPEKIRTNQEIYSFNVNSTIFDQCKEFGTVSNYSIFGVDLGHDVITNAATGCYYNTCNSYDANIVNIIDDDVKKVYGVLLFSNFYYYCDIKQEDYVCPDDFEYNGMCRQGEAIGGVCLSNGVQDADCEAKTPMKCGLTRVINGSLVPTCNVPPGPPSKYCTDPSMCVYANEKTGSDPSCSSFGSSIKNAANKTIQCANSSTWCPFGYSFNGTHCYNPTPQCDDNCSQVIEVAKYVTEPDIKIMPVWLDYLDNPGCFLTNQTTDRRRAYCGVGYVWPDVQYHYLPVGVRYFAFNSQTGDWDDDTLGGTEPIIINPEK